MVGWEQPLFSDNLHIQMDSKGTKLSLVLL